MTETDLNSGGLTPNSFEDVKLENFSTSEDNLVEQLQEQAFYDMPLEESLKLIHDLIALSGGQPYITSTN